MSYRESLKNKKRIVVKIGSSSLTHSETGKIDLRKLDMLVKVITDIHNQGREVILVSSGAIAVGKGKMGFDTSVQPSLSEKQAFAAIGQAQLMMIYQKFFSEYGQNAAQVLMTKYTMINDLSRKNAENTFKELLKLGAIPIVNENDTVSTCEIEFGDNDRLSSYVASVVEADLLILLSDIDGLYTDDPNANKDAKFISIVPEITKEYENMGKESSGSNVGTGGMSAKITAAKIATRSGTDMIIANADDINNIYRILKGEDVGTLFLAHKDEDFCLIDHLEE